MIDIILLGPEHEGNIGAICRVMKNFGFMNLVIIDPAVKIGEDARRRAKHANDILKKAKIRTQRVLNNYDYLVGTTSQLGNDYNIPRCTMSPEELCSKIPKKKKVGIIFGRESKGLFNSEIEKCDFLVSIPTQAEYPVMNLSHAVGVILYELAKNKKGKIGENIAPISKKEKDVLLKIVNSSMKNLEFKTKEKKDTQKTIWKKVIGKAMLTKREAFALMGFFRKIK